MRSLVFALLLVFISGCAQYVETNISVFHHLTPPLSGVSYAIVPGKEQEDSLEFQSYAKRVSSELKKHGMIETPYNNARYAVYLSYGIDNGKPVVASYPVYGETGIGSSFMTGTLVSSGNTSTYTGIRFNTPSYGVIGSERRTDIIFTSVLYVDIIEIAKLTSDKKNKVYEGKAIATGETGLLAPMMPPMIRSLFEDFPGENGISRKSKQLVEK